MSALSPVSNLAPADAGRRVTTPHLPIDGDIPALRLPPREGQNAAALLAAAYAADPLWQRLLTADQHAWLSGAVVRYGLHYGKIYTNPARTALALWLPPGTQTLTWPQLLGAGAALAPWHLPLNTLSRLRALHQARAARRVRHLGARCGQAFELVALAVSPQARGTDAGRRLLLATLAAMQVGKLPCYAETANLHTLPLALRLGFRVVGEANDPLAGTPQWALVR